MSHRATQTPKTDSNSKSLKFFIGSQWMSSVGDGCFHIAMSVVAFDLASGQESLVGLSWLIRTLPYFFALPILSPLSDRFKRRSVMRVADAGRFLLTGLMALLYFFEALTLEAFWVLVFIKSFGDILFLSARDAWIGQYPDIPYRAKINSLVQGGTQAGIICGIILVAVLLKAGASPRDLLAVDAASFFVSFILLLFISNPPRPEGYEYQSIFSLKQWKEVFSKAPLLPWILGITAIDNLFIMGPALVGSPALINIEMGKEWSAFAVYEIVLSISMLMVSTLFFKRPPKKLLKVVAIALFIDGFTHIPFVLCQSASDYNLLLLFVAVHGISIPMLVIPRTTWIQNNVPEHFQGRVFAAMSTVVLGITGLSCALVGFLMSNMGLRAGLIFAYGGAGAAICGIVAWFRFKGADS